MESLNWDKETLKECEKTLVEWDERPNSFYKSKLTMKVDRAEREHFRNCINFWKERLKHEN